MLEKLKMFVITHSSCIREVFVLNDEDSAQELNTLWHTTKFRYLPDPCVMLDKSALRDMRSILGIEKGKMMVLHIGSINYNKGFDRLFDMIMNNEIKDGKTIAALFKARELLDL